MLKSESVTQLLQVVELARRSHRRGIPIDRAYQDAIRDVAGRHRVAYQTIGDLCRRRLGLADISEFVHALGVWLGGTPDPLRKLIVRNADARARPTIEAYFDGGYSPLPLNTPGTAFSKSTPAESPGPVAPPAPPEELRLRLSPELSQRLQLALLANLGTTREEAALALIESGYRAERSRIHNHVTSL